MLLLSSFFSIFLFVTDATRVVQFAAATSTAAAALLLHRRIETKRTNKTRIVNAKKRKRESHKNFTNYARVFTSLSRSNVPSALARPPRSALLLHLLTVARDDC